MELYRKRYGVRTLLVMVALCAVLVWALRVWSGSRPANLYAGWLGHESVADRLHAAGELASLRAEAVGSIPELARSLAGDPAAEVRKASAVALARIAGAAGAASSRDAAAAALRDALGDPEPAVRAEAARALTQLTPEPEMVLAPLLRAARDADSRVRGEAVAALGRIQNKAKLEHPEVRRVIVDAINEDDYHVREMGIYAYWSTAEVSPDLSGRLLAASDVRARRAAVVALARSAIAASDAVPGLVEALSDRDRAVRLLAARALGNLADPSPMIQEALTRAVDDEDREVGRAAAQALAAIQALATIRD